MGKKADKPSLFCRSWGIAALCSLLLSTPAFCASKADLQCVISAVKRVIKARGQSTVELELPMDSVTLKLLTTTDGTVAPLIGYQAIPAFVEDVAKQRNFKNALIMPFDYLSDQQKLDLVEYSKRLRDPEQTFFQNRHIAGLKTREKVRLRFTEETTFLGKHYPAGSHEVDLSPSLLPYVEYGGPGSLKGKVGGVELHLRGEQPASELMNSAWTLEAAVGGERKHKHVHITSPVPWAKLQKNRFTGALQLTDFHRRLNVTADMISIVEDGAPISFHSQGGIDSGGPLKAENLSTLLDNWRETIKMRKDALKLWHKVAAVGARGPGFYDDVNVWGAEVRFLSGRGKGRDARAFLDSVQRQMDTQVYLANPERIEEWQMSMLYRVTRGEGLPAKGAPLDSRQQIMMTIHQRQIMMGGHYQKDWAKVLEQLPDRLREEFGWLITHNKWGTKNKKELLTRAPGYWLQSRFPGHEELKMLFHDWSRDPFYFDRPERAKAILDRQVQALRQLTRANGPGDVNRIMREFLISSGLYRDYLAASGIRVRFKLPK